MINHRLPTVFGVLVVVAGLAALAAPANAVEAQLGAKLLVCNACHGDNGVPRNATVPIIWGQQENFLVKQLHDFQSGDRNFEVMAWMAKTLSPEETASAAADFAKKGWPGPARSAGAAAASPPSSVALCQVCHQQNFSGGLTVAGQPAPRLAGQRYEYLVEAMRRFADGERTNNAEMVTIMKAVSPAEREAMARYMSGL
jgi:cytochrome c553